MTFDEEIRDLAEQLMGQSWRTKKPLDWDDDERAAYGRASVEEREAWLRDVFHGEATDGAVIEQEGENVISYGWDTNTGEIRGNQVRRLIEVRIADL